MKDWNKSLFIEIFLHGLIMGTINKLPGISGGLYAIIVGFYDHLMMSLKKIGIRNFFNSKKQIIANRWFGWGKYSCDFPL